MAVAERRRDGIEIDAADDRGMFAIAQVDKGRPHRCRRPLRQSRQRAGHPDVADRAGLFEDRLRRLRIADVDADQRG
jgi:hypothetical protein